MRNSTVAETAPNAGSIFDQLQVPEREQRPIPLVSGTETPVKEPPAKPAETPAPAPTHRPEGEPLPHAPRREETVPHKCPGGPCTF